MLKQRAVLLMWFSIVGARPYISFFTRPVGSLNGYEGHSGVTSSIKRGFSKLNMSFNFNPSENEIAERVVILSSVEALESCINLKTKNKIKCIIAGPNLMVMPFEANGILANPLIDTVIVPSDEVKQFYYYYNPNIPDNIYVWSIGVDVDYWKPSILEKKDKILIYWKTEPDAFIGAIESLVRKHGYEPIVIKYGNYTAQSYKAFLSEVKCAIFVSRSESQGIALAESWSMNVPTLVWNPQWFIYENYSSDIISSAPYLTESTGVFWKELHELDNLINKVDQVIQKASPRDWVINNMTDTLSSKRLLDIVGMFD